MKVCLLVGILAAAVSATTARNVICYHASWSVYGADRFSVESIDPTMCTHVVYAFAGLDPNGAVVSLDPWNDIGDEWHEGGFVKFARLRHANPSVKLLLGVGGWNEGPLKFQSVVRNPEKQKVFIESALTMIQRYRFDGLEIAWIFQDGVGGTLEDKNGLTGLLRRMREVFTKNNLLMGASTSALKRVVQNTYDVPAMSQYLDYINLMTYDFHGSWDGKTGHGSPLHPMAGEVGTQRELNVEAVVSDYLARGGVAGKLYLGTVGYGRTFTLDNPNNWGVNKPSRGAGRNEPLPYKTFCSQDLNGLWKKHKIQEQAVSFAVCGDQWVGYEDAQSLVEKVKFAKSKKLGGVSFWTLDMDDFRSVCGSGRYPLLRAINDEMRKP